MHRPLMSGDGFVRIFAERDPPRAMNVLLERAFAPPDILTSAQPDAINILAALDRPLAIQAFVQAWSDDARRREHLARSFRHLDDDALRAMIDHIEEDCQRGASTVAYRTACVELRRAHYRARPLLLARFAMVGAATRAALCEAIGWMPESPAILPDIIATEADRDVRNQADDIRRHWLASKQRSRSFERCARSRPWSMRSMYQTQHEVEFMSFAEFLDTVGQCIV